MLLLEKKKYDLYNLYICNVVENFYNPKKIKCTFYMN